MSATNSVQSVDVQEKPAPVPALDVAPSQPAAPETAPAVEKAKARAVSTAVPPSEKKVAPKSVATTKPVQDKPVPSAPAVAEGQLSGHIELIVGAGQSVAAEEIAEAVVYFLPDAGAPHPKPGEFQIYTHNKQFEPTSLVIPLGSTVKFPNQDEILHNVFSATPGSSFDLGLYGEGASNEYTFKKAGLVLINCNVHQAMQASVLVLDTPYFVHPNKDGDFRFAGLPAGPGKLMLWHPRAAPESIVVSLPSATPVGFRLAFTKPRVSQHLNKERKTYSRDRN